MSDSREQILNRLRAAARPFPHISRPAVHLPVVPLGEADRKTLKARFVAEAEKLDCLVHQVANERQARRVVMELLAGETAVSSWAGEQIPLPGLIADLEAAGIGVGSPADPALRIGISGADAALAATGSLVITSGAGRYRASTLLPPVHIAVIREEQILPDLESWFARRRAAGLESLRAASNVVIISGPSRTADIAMELVLGIHGPGELHIILQAS